MRYRSSSALCSVVALLIGAASASAQGATALIGATVLDGSGLDPITDGVVLVREGMVECVGDRSTCPVPEGAFRVDAAGRWIVPGLVDSHIHWQVWYDADRRLTLQTAARAGRVYLANGITTVIDVGGQRWVSRDHREVLNDLMESGAPAPGMLFSAWVDRGEVDRSGLGARELTRSLLDSGVSGVKIRNGLTREEIAAIVQEADGVGVPVYGHTYDTVDGDFLDYTAEAAALGVDGIFHVLGIPPVPAESRPPPPEIPVEDWEGWWAAGADLWNHVTDAGMDALILQMVDHGTWLQPTLVTEESVVEPGWFRDDPAWRHSPMTREEWTLGWPAFDEEELAIYRSAFRQMKRFVLRFHESGGMLVAGTDGLPIPGFGVQEEMRLLVDAGIPPAEAILAATRNAARAWGQEGRFGVLAPGRAADLVILEADPLADITNTRRIWRVMKSGTLHDPAELLR